MDSTSPPPPVRRRLAAWMALHNITQQEFADRIGCSRQHVSHIINGLVPSQSYRHKIDAETRGEIKAGDW
jgi:transcriptional regulator with XRE-family HTH domain